MGEVENKKRHHYVMRNYLKRWKGVDNEKSKKEGIWVIDKVRKSNFFCTDLNSIAQINYFYKLNMDPYIFGLLLSKYKEYPICQPVLDWMSTLIYIDEYKNKKLDNFEKLDVINNIALENEYSRIESALAILLQYADENFDSFITSIVNKPVDLQGFVALFVFQAFRTKSMMNKLNEVMRRVFVDLGDGVKIELSKEQKENYFRVSSYLEAVATTSKIVSNGFTIDLLINNTNKLFITSDAPAVIISGSDLELSSLVGYIPLTPTLGMLIRGYRADDGNLKVRVVDQKKVIHFNKLIKNSFGEQIYSKVKQLI